MRYRWIIKISFHLFIKQKCFSIFNLLPKLFIYSYAAPYISYDPSLFAFVSIKQINILHNFLKYFLLCEIFVIKCGPKFMKFICKISRPCTLPCIINILLGKCTFYYHWFPAQERLIHTCNITSYTVMSTVHASTVKKNIYFKLNLFTHFGAIGQRRTYMCNT